jgi:3-hydroxyisobutyrate dehydrogenase-like beta-hydroxyacid dehydrogenase
LLTPASSIAVIGFGEVGRRIAVPLARRGVALRAHDRLLHATATSRQMRERIEAAGLDAASTVVDALRGARLVIAAVGRLASRGLVQEVAPQLTSGQLYLNLSNIPTAEHLESAALVERHGAHYLAGLADTPLLLAGARAETLAAALENLGCSARAVAVEPQCLAMWQSAAADPGRYFIEAAPDAPLRGELP